jgi:hypothetical protein
MKPSVGRVVHYVTRGSADGAYPAKCRAAIITETDEDAEGFLSLAVLHPDGLLFARHIRQDDQGPYDEDGTPRGGTWHWPERVDA